MKLATEIIREPEDPERRLSLGEVTGGGVGTGVPIQGLNSGPSPYGELDGRGLGEGGLFGEMEGRMEDRTMYELGTMSRRRGGVWDTGCTLKTNTQGLG